MANGNAGYYQGPLSMTPEERQRFDQQYGTPPGAPAAQPPGTTQQQPSAATTAPTPSPENRYGAAVRRAAEWTAPFAGLELATGVGAPAAAVTEGLGALSGVGEEAAKDLYRAYYRLPTSYEPPAWVGTAGGVIGGLGLGQLERQAGQSVVQHGIGPVGHVLASAGGAGLADMIAHGATNMAHLIQLTPEALGAAVGGGTLYGAYQGLRNLVTTPTLRRIALPTAGGLAGTTYSDVANQLMPATSQGAVP